MYVAYVRVCVVLSTFRLLGSKSLPAHVFMAVFLTAFRKAWANVRTEDKMTARRPFCGVGAGCPGPVVSNFTTEADLSGRVCVCVAVAEGCFCPSTLQLARDSNHTNPSLTNKKKV